MLPGLRVSSEDVLNGVASSDLVMCVEGKMIGEGESKDGVKTKESIVRAKVGAVANKLACFIKQRRTLQELQPHQPPLTLLRLLVLV